MKNNNKINIINKSKRHRKYSKKRYMLYYIFFGIIIIVTFLILSLTVLFNIKNIEISGNTKHSEEEILKVCGIMKGDNLILTNCKKSESFIYDFFKDIDQITVTKSFPNTIIIECDDAVVDFCCQKDDDNFLLVSKNKRIISTDEKETPNDKFTLIIDDVNFDQFKEGDKFALPTEKEKIFNMLKKEIETENITDITKITIKDDGNIYVAFQNRVTLEIKDIAKTNYLLNMSKIALKNSIGSHEKGKLIYIQNKKELHFIPSKFID